MGCSSSREARPEAADTQASATVRTAQDARITSTTAINTPLPTASRQPSNTLSLGPRASASNISTPRTSTTDHRRQQPEISLTDPYNVPLSAPKPWTSTERSWTRPQLQRERQDFFDTRVTGRPEIWAALKEVTDLIRHGDLVEAQGILDAAGITLPTGQLEQGAYDERGMLYRLPENIVSDPLNVVDDDGATMIGDESLSKQIEAGSLTLPLPSQTAEDAKLDKGKEAVEKDAIKVRCRLSDRGGPDTVVLLGQEQPVGVLLRRLRAEATITSSARVRIVYFGKILEESKTLEEQGWQQGHIVQALVSNFAT